jgi:hypothetical protein
VLVPLSHDWYEHAFFNQDSLKQIFTELLGMKAYFFKRVSIERRNSFFVVTLGILKPFLPIIRS